MSNSLSDLLGEIETEAAKVVDDSGFYDRSALAETDWEPDLKPLDITLRGYQRAAVETILQYRRGILGFAPGMGKRLAEGTPVLTPDGWTPIENIKVGDLVIGGDGKSYDVSGVFSEPNRPLYRVTFQDGSWVDADDEHLWKCKRYNNGKWQTLTTKEIVDKGVKDHSDGKRRWRIPLVEPVTGFTSKAFIDDPYVVGVVLGDGTPRHENLEGVVGWNVCTDKEILEEINAQSIKPHETSKYTGYGNVWLLGYLKPGRSWEKEIPENYLLGSTEQRIALLQGLMDTDGTPHKDTGAEFSSSSPNLVDGVSFLVRSLGGLVTGRIKCHSTYTYKGKKKKGRPAERIRIKLPPEIAPFRLKRKAELYSAASKYQPMRAIESIERIKNGPGYCISVSSPDNTFVTKDFIVTHNTVVALTAIANSSGKTVAVVPPSLKMIWAIEAERCFPHLNVVTISGEKSAAIPEGDLLVIGDSIVSDRLKDIQKWGPNNLIVDEAQRHKNFKAKRAKATLKISESIRENDGMVILLTGTLAVNRADEVWMPANIAGVARKITGSADYYAWLNKWCYVDEMPVEQWRNKKKVTVWVKIPKGAKNPEGLHEALRSTAYIRVEREDALDMPDKVFAYHSLKGDKENMKNYNFISKDFEKWLMEQGGEEAVEKAGGAIKLVQLGKLIEAAGLAKIKSSAEYISALVEEGEQVVVMGHHKNVVRGLKEELKGLGIDSVLFYGEMNDAEKRESYRSFKAGEVPVFIGNTVSAGTGLNLENSAELVFVQLPWSPGDFVQASDRIYRVTQTRKCTIHILSTAGTIDEHVSKVLKEKSKIVDAINAGKIADDADLSEESVADEVLGMLY